MEVNNTFVYFKNNYYDAQGEFNYINSSDEKLAALYVGEKDDKAFNELVSRFGDKIYRLSLRLTKSPHTAEEVLQLVFLKLIEKTPQNKIEKKISSFAKSLKKQTRL